MFSVLKKYFGYSEFRLGQQEVITSLLSGTDTMVIMPTGGGKSICYQVPAMLMPGCAIVISPLIALMQDQVDALKSAGYPAEAVNSFKSEAENRDIINRAATGNLKLLYISPERMIQELPAITGNFSVSFFAIDEAHCISHWGHDFRPVYTTLAQVRNSFPDAPIMALTATADALTRSDIALQLGMRNPYIHISSFNRPNLSLTVIPSPPKKGKIQIIRQLNRRYPTDSGIVYCLSRKITEEVCEALTATGVNAVCYHAGMSAADRQKSQELFLNGDVDVVVATVAFGMGINKSNIRWVVHYNLPANIESYYQEIGRAGRDGLPAETVLFYSYQDVILRENLISDSEHAEVFRSKLESIKQFAEANVCRRRILLSYFNEEFTSDCGNCDVCKNPPERFNGSIVAQKAMSAIVRTGMNVAMRGLIDILVGASTPDVKLHNYHLLPTYGVGRDLSRATWQALVGQMIQLGLIQVDLDRYNRLSVTPYGYRILRGEEQVEMSRPNISAPSAKETKISKTYFVPQDPIEALFEQLKAVRRNIAKTEGIPDFIIFNDATLMEMAREHPLSIEAFRDIKGVGEIKAVKYWKKFVGEIRKFDGLKNSTTGSSIRETLILHNARHRPSDIAKIKGVQTSTIYGHLAELIIQGLITEFSRIITPEQLDFYVANRDRDNAFELFDEHLPKGLWRVAKAIAESRVR